jgi:hypothetical protein
MICDICDIYIYIMYLCIKTCYNNMWIIYIYIDCMILYVYSIDILDLNKCIIVYIYTYRCDTCIYIYTYVFIYLLSIIDIYIYHIYLQAGTAIKIPNGKSRVKSQGFNGGADSWGSPRTFSVSWLRSEEDNEGS